MMRWRRPISPEVRALLDRERPIPPQLPAVRARAIARARAALVISDAPSPAAPPVTVPRLRWAVVGVLASVASAAVGVTAYAIHARKAPAPTTERSPAIELAAPRPARPIAPAPIARPETPPETHLDMHPMTARALGAPRLSQAETVAEELRLLRQARAAVGREDFTAALAPIAEHARRFKNGRLAEEREALRVRALAGLGRTEEARRAAASFRAHFPHSVLLSAVNKMPATGP